MFRHLRVEVDLNLQVLSLFVSFRRDQTEHKDTKKNFTFLRIFVSFVPVARATKLTQEGIALLVIDWQHHEQFVLVPALKVFTPC